MRTMLSSKMSKMLDHLTAMGFDSVCVEFSVPRRSVRATNTETDETIVVSPMRPAHVTLGTVYWGDYGWEWTLTMGGAFVASQSSEDWQIWDALESIDTYGMGNQA